MSSDEEVDPSQEESLRMEEIHDLLRQQFLAELTAGNAIDMENEIFKSLPYGDQLGILDDVREIYRFGRSNITPYVR